MVPRIDAYPWGVVKILDMGLARYTDPNTGQTATHLTQLGSVMGTPEFIAPEQARDSHNSDIRADLYSLGCTLYFLLTGHPPFDQGTIPQRLLAHQHQQPEDLCKVRDDVPEALAAICRKMLVKERARRYQAAAEVEADLAAFLAGKPTSLAGEEDLLRIDLAEEEVPAPAKAAPPAEAPAAAAVAQVAATAASVAAAASGSAGSSPSSGSSSAAALSLPPIEAPDPFGAPALPGGVPASPLVPLAPLATTDLMPLGSSVLQPIAPPSGAAIETMSGLMETTQSIPKQQLAAARSLQPAAPAQPSLRQTIVQLVAEPAKEGEGIGGLKYKLWFLIVFGILSGLILAGVGYSIMRTYNPQPAPEKAGFER
jgi:serine/threonine protein kinase